MPKGTDVQVGFFCPQSKQIYRKNAMMSLHALVRSFLAGSFQTLLAAFVFNLSKIFSDCCLLARALILIESVVDPDDCMQVACSIAGWRDLFDRGATREFEAQGTV
jgi:hypothetical protein